MLGVTACRAVRFLCSMTRGRVPGDPGGGRRRRAMRPRGGNAVRTLWFGLLLLGSMLGICSALGAAVGGSVAGAATDTMTGLHCFAVANGSHGQSSEGDGVTLVPNAASIEVKVNYAKDGSVLGGCPLRGYLQLYQLTYRLQGKTEEWSRIGEITAENTDGAYKEWSSTVADLLPDKKYEFYVRLVYAFKDYDTPKREVRTLRDLAAGMDVVPGAVTGHSITVSQHLRPSAYGTTTVWYDIKKSGGKSWYNVDRVFTCQKGAAGTCEQPGSFTFTTSSGPAHYGAKSEPIQPDTAYLLRVVVQNTWSGTQGGPELQIRTPAA
jgi:hypothetical protein